MKIKGKPGTQSVPCPRSHTPKKSKRAISCGASTRVLRTRRLPTGVVRRKRECTRGHVFTTEEKETE